MIERQEGGIHAFIQVAGRRSVRLRPHVRRVADLGRHHRLLAGGRRGRLATGLFKRHAGRGEEEGIDLKFADAQGKEEEQLKAVRSFIAQKVDAIIIAPVVVTGWDQVLAEAKKAGIPVFLADRDVDVADKSLFVTRISADFNLEDGSRARGSRRRARGTATSSNCKAPSARRRRSNARRALRRSSPTSRT